MAMAMSQQASSRHFASPAVAEATPSTPVPTVSVAKVFYEGIKVHLPTNVEYHIKGGVLTLQLHNFTGQLVLQPASDSPAVSPAPVERTTKPATSSQATAGTGPAGSSPASASGHRILPHAKGLATNLDMESGTTVAPSTQPQADEAEMDEEVEGVQESASQLPLPTIPTTTSAAADDWLEPSQAKREAELAMQASQEMPAPPTSLVASGNSLPATQGSSQSSTAFAFTQRSGPTAMPSTQSSADSGSDDDGDEEESKASLKRPRSPVLESPLRVTSRRVGPTNTSRAVRSTSLAKPGVWTTLSCRGTAPEARWAATAVAVPGSGKVVLYGGSGEKEVAMGDTHVFKIATRRWSRPVSSDGLPSQFHTCVVVPAKNLMLAFGGERTSADGHSEFLSELRTLDTSIMSWLPAHTNGRSPAGRSGAAAALLNDSLVVVFGGIRGRKWLDEVVCLDTDSWRWFRPKVVGKAPPGRSYHTCTGVGNRIVVFGGNDGFRSFSNVHVLEVTNEGKWLWQQPAVFGEGPCARTGHTATLLPGGHIAITGGWDPNEEDKDPVPFDDVFILNTDSWSWTKVDTSVATTVAPTGTSPDSSAESARASFARTGHAAVFATMPELGSGLLVFGGKDCEVQERNDITFLPLPSSFD